MRTFKVYASPIGKSEAVKQGWSWPGFFFNGIWALFKKLWLIAILFIVFFFTLGFIEGIIELESGADAAAMASAFSALFNLVAAIIFGAFGNKLRESNLISRGFEYQDTLEADNPEAAIALWTKQRNQSVSA